MGVLLGAVIFSTFVGILLCVTGGYLERSLQAIIQCVEDEDDKYID